MLRVMPWVSKAHGNLLGQRGARHVAGSMVVSSPIDLELPGMMMIRIIDLGRWLDRPCPCSATENALGHTLM